MLLTKSKLALVILTAALVGCAPQLTGGKTEKKKKNGGEIATIDESGGEIAMKDGSQVSIPPGVLAAGSSVTLQPTEEPAEFAALSEVSKASTPVELSARDAAGNLIKSVPTPMTINLPLSGSGLALLEDTSDTLCAILKSFDDELFVWRRDSLTINEAQASVQFKSKNFGVFQLVYCGRRNMPGFTDAANLGVTGDTQLTLALTIPGNFTVYTGGKHCFFLLAEEDTSDGSEGTVVAVSEAAGVSGKDVALKLAFAETKISADQRFFLAVTFQEKDSACPLGEGDSIGEHHSLGFKAVMAFGLQADEILAGIAASIGEAPFAYETLQVRLGGPTGMVTQPSGRADSACLSVDHESEGLTELSVTTASDLLIDGKSSVALAVPVSDDKSPRFRGRFGGACGDVVASDLLTARPFQAELIGFDYGDTVYLLPVKMGIKPDFSAAATGLGGVAGCINLWPSGGANDVRRSSYQLSLTTTSLVDVLLPYAATPGLFTLAGTQPLYDLELAIVSDDCEARSTILLPTANNPQTITGTALNSELVIPE